MWTTSSWYSHFYARTEFIMQEQESLGLTYIHLWAVNQQYEGQMAQY